MASLPDDSRAEHASSSGASPCTKIRHAFAIRFVAGRLALRQNRARVRDTLRHRAPRPAAKSGARSRYASSSGASPCTRIRRAFAIRFVIGRLALHQNPTRLSLSVGGRAVAVLGEVA